MINVYWYYFNKDFSLFKTTLNNIDIYIDEKFIYDNDNIKIAILCEPRAIDNSTYQFVEQNFNKYNYILTFDDYLLNLDKKKVIKCLYGTTWVSKSVHLKLNNNNISFLIGNKQISEGHHLRKNLYNHFIHNSNTNGNINIFISGNCPIENDLNFQILGDNKSELFSHFGYHFAIENSKQINYFTEKIIDCFQTMTVPIYWGCPNIAYYFDIEGIIFIQDNDVDNIINFLETIDFNSFYEKNIEHIKNNYELSNKYLNYEKNFIDIINNLDIF